MKQKRLVKSQSKKLCATLTVSSLLMMNFSSTVVALAQGPSDIKVEEGALVPHLEDWALPEPQFKKWDLGNIDDLRMSEVERGQLKLSEIEESKMPSPINRIEVQVENYEELQRVINEAMLDTALVINIINSFDFNEVILIEDGKDIPLQSTDNHTLTQRSDRHFTVSQGGSLR